MEQTLEIAIKKLFNNKANKQDLEYIVENGKEYTNAYNFALSDLKLNRYKGN